MQAPDRHISGLLIAHALQVFSDIDKDAFSSKSPVEWALCLNRGRLRPSHACRTNQRPKAVVTGQRQHHAFNTGVQAQAVTGEIEAAHHGDDPLRSRSSAYTRARSEERRVGKECRSRW